MKKLQFGFILMIVFCAISCFALANSWGLTGPLLNYVMGIEDFEDYSASALYYYKDCPITAAVMSSRYHNVLLVCRTDANGNQSVWQSTTAVWQPDANAEPVLTCTEDTVTLKAFLFGTYTFGWDENENTFILTRAEYGDFVLSLQDGVYYSQSGKVWQAQPIDIESFNVSLFPSTEYEMLRMNRIYAALSDASDFWHTNIVIFGGKTLPVYSAPDENSYRAAKKKAAVNTSENFQLLASIEGWDLVEYEVSLKTHRIGWINNASLPEYAPVMMTDVQALSADYLTDDPFWSQYQAFDSSQLQNIHLLALTNPFYAYASAETTDGQTVWGFVPVTGCSLPDEVIDEAVMSDMRGTWEFTSGGEIASAVMALHADGSCEVGELPDGSENRQTGTWYVIDSLSNIGYEKTLILKINGRVASFGLLSLPAKNEEGRMAVTLCCGETGGGYVKLAEENQPLDISSIELTYTDSEADTRTYGFGYEKLEERFKTFFPEEIWGKARFLVDSDWEKNAAYNAEHNLGVYRHYPIVTVLGGSVQVHLFDIEDGNITKLASTRLDSGIMETEDCKVTAPLYYMCEWIDETDGTSHYRETLSLDFFSVTDPWNMSITLETETPDDPDILHLTCIIFQYDNPRQTLLLNQKYDYEVIAPTTEGLEYSYAYYDEPISDTLFLPIKIDTAFAEFSIVSVPDDPENLMLWARVDTTTNGKGGKLKLRSESSKKGKVLAEIPNGTGVKAIDLENGWSLVKYQGKFGYVMSEFLVSNGQ